MTTLCSRSSVLAALALLTAGCTRATTPPRSSEPGIVEFSGACDASGAVTLDGGLMLVADDEDNVLRVYDGRRGGAPLRSLDLSPVLGLPGGKKKPPEVDLEAATRLGERAYWMSSHGRSSSGKAAPARLRFFATRGHGDARDLELVGRPYTRLVDDLIAAPQLARFQLARAEALPPKDEGGLNLEGMTAMPDGRSILIGFRSPVPGGQALLVPLLNPAEVVEGGSAGFGAPVLVDLHGLGVRSLSWWRGRYLIIGGGVASGTPSRLFTWKGRGDAPVEVPGVELGSLNPEAFISPEESDEILLLSDDGTVEEDGVACKKQKNVASKRFRGKWIRLP